MKKANIATVFSVIFLVFIGSILNVDATFLGTNEKVGFSHNTPSDIFGIEKIYPTKTDGNTWYMNMANPTSDPRFDPLGPITQNPDGSWKMQQNQVRMVVYSTDKTTYESTLIPTYSRTLLDNTGYMQLPSDWRNFEMTGYVKLNEASEGSSYQFTWYGRGGTHTVLNNGCEGSKTSATLSFDGETQFEKESWHVQYDFSDLKTSTPPLFDRWIGFKFIVYNQPGITFAQQVHHEIWLDEFNINNWVKVHAFNDDGYGSGADHCGPAIADNMPISWGGPEATFRVDDADDFDFKYLSVREIPYNPAPPLLDLDNDGIPDELDNENIINLSTTIIDSHTVFTDVTVKNGALLTISNGVALTITSGNKMIIESGSGILIESGGTLQINS